MAPLVKQLISRFNTLLKTLIELYNDNSSKIPTSESQNLSFLNKSFFDVFSSFKRVFIVIDALNECTDETLKYVVSKLVRKCFSIPVTKILATSRLNPGRIEKLREMKNTLILIIETNDLDIKNFMAK